VSSEPKVSSAPWSEVGPALDRYEERAGWHRVASYVLFFVAFAGGVLALVLGARALALPLLLFALAGRAYFALFNAKASPRCPGCRASLGWDFRGSPSRTARVRKEHSCPGCGIPFVQ
jgi:hypothetical protein